MNQSSKNTDYSSSLKKLHKGGFIGLCKSYFSSGWFVFNYTFFVSLIIAVIAFLFGIRPIDSITKSIELLQDIIDVGISVDGGLIGLSLAGLTILVTFGNDKLMNLLVGTTIDEFKKSGKVVFSSYQTAVAKFSWAVLIQAVVLVFLICNNTIIGFELSSGNMVNDLIINKIGITLAIFLITYSLLLVIQMTLNIFTVGQMYNNVIISQLMKEDVENSKSGNGHSTE